MSSSLIFNTYKSIFNRTKLLYEEASEIKCTKERRKRIRKLKRDPTVRMCQLITSAAGYECGTPKKLTNDEQLFKYALENFGRLQLSLDEFRQKVLKPEREDIMFQHWWNKLYNESKQHPDFSRERVVWELSFYANPYLECGKTYYEEMLRRAADENINST